MKRISYLRIQIQRQPEKLSLNSEKICFVKIFWSSVKNFVTTKVKFTKTLTKYFIK